MERKREAKTNNKLERNIKEICGKEEAISKYSEKYTTKFR